MRLVVDTVKHCRHTAGYQSTGASAIRYKATVDASQDVLYEAVVGYAELRGDGSWPDRSHIFCDYEADLRQAATGRVSPGGDSRFSGRMSTERPRFVHGMR